MTSTDTLAQPFALPNGQVVPNRLVKSAMSETLAGPDNRVPETMAVLYERWARGGIGLSITGNVMVDRNALGEPGNVALRDEVDMPMLKRWAEGGKKHGGLIYMQLNHPGRQVPKFLNPESVAPSAVPFRKEMQAYFSTPRALDGAEIEAIIGRFANAARLAEKAGFDGVQIHGAHGYLVSQFLSPHVNRREDEWGGSPEKRRRFAIEIYRAIRKATGPKFGVSIKINSADFQKGGITEEESTEQIIALASEGMDFVEISGGNYESPKMMGNQKESTKKREAYFLSFAETLRKSLKVPLVVTGGFRSGKAMAEAIDSGAVDFVGLARTLAIVPDFPNDLLRDEHARVDITPRNTGIKALDKLGMLELTWYERQLHRMGRGKEPRPDESPLLSAAKHTLTSGFQAFRTRRAR